MPLSNYDKNFGGKSGSAQKAKAAMADEYGEKKGEQVFYATKNRNKAKGKGMIARAKEKMNGNG